MIPNTGREWNILNVSAFLMNYFWYFLYENFEYTKNGISFNSPIKNGQFQLGWSRYMPYFLGKIVSPKPIFWDEIFLKAGVYLFPHTDDKEGVAMETQAQYTTYQLNDTQHRQRMKYSECFSIFNELFLIFSIRKLWIYQKWNIF